MLTNFSINLENRKLVKYVEINDNEWNKEEACRD